MPRCCEWRFKCCVCFVGRNEQYYEAILSIWNQLFINVKSLIAWQYCLLDIRHINSLTISMVSDAYVKVLACYIQYAICEYSREERTDL